jgi:hypothetical protein
MTAIAKTTDQEAEKTGFLDRLNRLSLRNKVIGVAVLVFLVLVIVSIPGDRNELLARQERIEAAQVARELSISAVGPITESVKAFLDGTEIDLSENRSYTGLERNLTSFDNANSTVANRFQAVVSFSKSVHSLLEGSNAVAELDTVEFRKLVAEMDVTLSVDLLALIEMNVSIDEYNGYHSWISASLAGALFNLPQGYDDPIPSRSRLSSTSLDQ